ncbi:MAG TPA: hypothetical protein VE593_12265 [Nitrososphaeraceae archaeon]|nr:hypothetical protein [Nitrososphaeraceae archaeon]
MIKNTSPSVSSVVIVALLALSIVGVTTTTTTISQFSSIDVVKSAYAFPCKGGIGEEYCSGYHAGAIQADKDDNANRNLDVSQHRCTSTIQQYCQGFVNGYNDEVGFLK